MPRLTAVQLKQRVLLTAVTLVALGLIAAHFVRAAGQSRWIALASNDWASIEIEPALYERPGQARYLSHFRIVNKTRHSLALNLEDPGVGWPNLAATNRTTLGEGNHRGIVSELIAFPLGDDLSRKERNLTIALRTGKAATVPAGGTLDYFIPAQTGTRADLYRQYGRWPLWIKAKTYWPWAPIPTHLILVLRGAVSLGDGTKTKTLNIFNREFGLPFPLKWKTVPMDARVMKNP